MHESGQILENAKSILLVDWPGPEVPRALVHSGFKVFCYSPGGYSEAGIVTFPPEGFDRGRLIPPANEEEKGYLIFNPLKHPPASIDIVSIYRPPEEHAEIFRGQVLPLAAKVIWLQPPVESAELEQLALLHELIFIRGKDIRELAQGRFKKKHQE